MLAAKALGAFTIMSLATGTLIAITLVMLAGHILLKPLKDRIFPPQYAAIPR